MFDELFSLRNLLQAWRKFRSGKTRKRDVVSFEYHLEDNIFSLYEEMTGGAYKHKAYKYFPLFDNKKRDIYKADVRDRIIHQIVYEYLLSLYEQVFISDSYSSREGKGHHKAVRTLQYFIKLGSGGKKDRCFVLKCDIKKYFDTIDHSILLRLMEREVVCPEVLSLIQEIVGSFNQKNEKEKGIPLGNITSQIFANVYLHPLDRYIKRELRCRFYVRYNDDFVIVSNNQNELEAWREKIIDFVHRTLALRIPVEKTSIRKVAWGIDFLGFVVLPDSVLLRNKTKGKIVGNINERNMNSYMGVLAHCNSYHLKQKILSTFDDCFNI